MQVMRTSSTPRYAVAANRAQRDGTEYQAPSILTIARELISTGMGLRTSKLVAGAGSSCTRSSAHSSLADLPVRAGRGTRRRVRQATGARLLPGSRRAESE